MASKAQKEFMSDLKRVYGAVNRDAAQDALLDLEQKWGEQYPVVAGKQGTTVGLLRVHAAHPTDHLHDQHRGGLPPPTAESH